MSIYEVLSTAFIAVQTVAIVLTCVIALVNYKKGKTAERRKYVSDLLSEFINNDDLYAALHIIEFESNWFYGNNFYKKDGDSYEKKIDRLFVFLNNVIFLYNHKDIEEEDFDLFKYKINAVFQSESARQYLLFIEEFANKCRNSKSSFQQLIDYGRKQGLL